MTIKEKNIIPYYFQIKADILRRIKQGDLKENDKLTPETVLAEEYGVSRPTVRQAINELVFAGYLWRHRGKGTFVAPPRIQENLLFYTPFAEKAEELGKKPKLKVLSERLIKANSEIASTLNINIGDDLIELVGLRLADKEPILLRTSYFPANLFPNLFEELSKGIPIIQIVEKNGIYPERAVQTFQVVSARASESKYLKVPQGTPLILWEGVVYTDKEEPYELTRAFYRSDKYLFHIDQHRSKIIEAGMRDKTAPKPTS